MLTLTFEDIFEDDEKTVREIVKNKKQYYYSYPIQKSNGGKRYIDAPFGKLKEYQERILKRYLYQYGPHPIAYGFAKNKNPVMAAEQHVGATIVVAMDIKNFFNSISKKQVEETLIYMQSNKRRLKSPWDIIPVITEVLTLRKAVPQGAPTSPAISNLVMLKNDKIFKNLAKKYNGKVTRYADDIVFSTKDEEFAKDLPKVIPQVKGILRRTKFYLNHEKTRVMRDYRRMVVNGVVVNEKTNIPRETWRNFRAKLHNLKVNQTPVSQKEAEKLRGKIEWFKSINPKRGKKFLTEFGKLRFSNT